MPFIDYNKAYHMVQRSWIIESLLLVQVHQMQLSLWKDR